MLYDVVYMMLPYSHRKRLHRTLAEYYASVEAEEVRPALSKLPSADNDGGGGNYNNNNNSGGGGGGGEREKEKAEGEMLLQWEEVTLLNLVGHFMK